MMKNEITVERLKALVQEYMVLEKDEMENSTEWAYVALEPALVACKEVTLNYLMQIDKDEFITLGENHYFEDILSKFKSAEILNLMLLQYANFFGQDASTDFYHDSINGLRNCILGKADLIFLARAEDLCINGQSEIAWNYKGYSFRIEPSGPAVRLVDATGVVGKYFSFDDMLLNHQINGKALIELISDIECED